MRHTTKKQPKPTEGFDIPLEQPVWGIAMLTAKSEDGTQPYCWAVWRHIFKKA